MMRTITELGNTVRAVELAELRSTVAAHAAVEIVDPHTLAIVPFRGYHTAMVEQALRSRSLGAREITTAHDIITVTI